MLEACRPPREYGDVLKMLAGLMSLFKEPTTHCTLWQGRKARGHNDRLAPLMGGSADNQHPAKGRSQG